LFYRRWFSREQIDAEFLEMIIQSAMAGSQRHDRLTARRAEVELPAGAGVSNRL